MQKWQVIKTEDVSPNKWFPVFRDTVKTSKGDIVDDFYYGRLGKIVLILPITKDNEVIFVRQYRHGVKEVMIELPAGMVEGEEALESRAVKELEEEIGVAYDEDNLKFLGKSIPVPHKLDMTVYSYLAKDVELTLTQKLEKLEDLEIVGIPSKEIFDLVEKGEINQPDTITALLRASLKYPNLFTR